jgi:methyl-accepting chemotaxis protein
MVVSPGFTRQLQPAAPPPHAPELVELLERWSALGELERRAFIATVEDLNGANALIERSTLDLSSGFRELAAAASEQTRRVAATAEIARSIRVGGAEVGMSEATRFVADVIGQATDALDAIGTRSERMAKALGGMEVELRSVEDCVAQIERINRQARYVALNAAIEAQRGSGAGGGSTFMVIAQEVRDLARDTDDTARLVRERIAALAAGMRLAREDLAGLADTGGGDQHATREKLRAVLAGMTAQSEALATITDEATQASAQVGGLVGRLVTAAQFQDRCTQHLQHVIGAIETLGTAIQALQEETFLTIPDMRGREQIDHDLMRMIVDNQTLSSVQQHFIARLNGRETLAQELPTSAGDVELF